MKLHPPAKTCVLEYRAHPYKLHFQIAGLPASANVTMGRNVYIARTNSKKWKKEVFNLIRGYLPKTPLKSAMLTLVRFNWRTLDFDGLVISFKPVVDGLCPLEGISTGIMENDSWKATGVWRVDQRYAPRGSECIQVTVEAFV